MLCGKWVAVKRKTVVALATAVTLALGGGALAVAQDGTAGGTGSLGGGGGNEQVQPPAVAGAVVQKVDWLTDRRVALWVESPSMATPIQVQLLLARDFHAKPQERFPQVYMLDGMRATDLENGWTAETDAESFFADKNVNVVLPVGGQSSFYSDWVDQDNGKNYQWETFLTKELPPILAQDWRSTDTRGVVGLSMGGTSAVTLAARNPGFFKFAGSLSGILATSTLGMPQAIQYAMMDAGGFDSRNMWGAPSSDNWAEHDPYVLADKLKGVSLYISSGSGTQGPYDQPSGIPGLSNNLAGTGLEILSRLSSQVFATKLQKLGIPAKTVYRPSGTHSWPYWQFELHELWPQLAGAIGVDANKPACEVTGVIAGVAGANQNLGDCLTGTYQVGSATVQDFRFGQVVAANNVAQPLFGRIGGAYLSQGGPTGVLGVPTTGELPTPDGRGRFNHFEHGSVYWTPQTGAVPIRGAIRDEWAAQGWEHGPLGYPTLAEVPTPGKPGAVQGFEIGAMYFSPATGTHSVQGVIYNKFAELGWEGGWLGFPKTNELPLRDGGRFNVFENGNVYWTPLSGAWPVANGPILDAWGREGFENGRLGYPISDRMPIAGGVQQNFQHGSITQIGDRVEVH